MRFKLVPGPKLVYLSLTISLLSLITITILLPPAVVSADLPPRPDVELPEEEDDEEDTPLGAYITLSASAGTWTVVQWQGNDGRWHDVEGWRGTLEGHSKTWWVAHKDFSTGPFRWIVYQSQNAPIVAISPPFTLPSEPNQTTQIVATSASSSVQ